MKTLIKDYMEKSRQCGTPAAELVQIEAVLSGFEAYCGQKPTAPAGLVEELKGDFTNMLHVDGEFNYIDELDAILFRYRDAKPQESLAELAKQKKIKIQVILTHVDGKTYSGPLSAAEDYLIKGIDTYISNAG